MNFSTSRHRANRRSNLTGLGLILSVIGVIAVVILIGSCAVGYSKTVTLHVTGKESVNTQDGHEYRIYTVEDTYKIADTLMHGRFNSANFYGKFPVPAPGGEPIKLTCVVFGYRIPVLSSFKNVKSCQGV